MVKRPFFWLCRAIINPVFTLLYQAYRLIKKAIVAVTEPMRDRAMSLLANRYAIHVVVILLVFSVTATNIYASDGGGQANDGGQKSILGGLTQNEEEAVVVEAASSNANVNGPQDVSYLGSQALSSHDAATGADDGTDDEAYVDDETELDLVSPMANAVRVQPQPDEEAAPATRTRVEEYTVAEGDTLGSIARQFDLRTETLLASNGLTVRSILRIGQVLKILPVDGVIYKVRNGDTISKIAKVYDSDAEKILEMNGLSSGAALAAGTELILPDGKLPPPPPPKQPSRIAKNIKNIFVPPPSPDRSGGDDMIWPTAARRITQYFGHYRGGSRHTGVDIAGPIGTAIYAADDGVVAIAGWNSGGYGNMVLIDHGGGLYTRYGHASKLLVKAGDTVKRGDVIALIGSTGHSTGPHLHFEVMTGNPHNRKNPLEYVGL
ncbi:MAG TPA: M23 family metallopeptidase [Candidatus Binatia bacterium]|jgi:murein DD-endopeptidase MepM/ murein hydrolase activator NlpD|nr:M23 family metallopeptidase [Candidatus Binatia bacterium]